MTVLKAGSRWRSQVDATEVIVVRAPDADVALTCGGHPMIDVKAEPEAGLELKPELSGGSPVGKRFVDVAGTAEILVTKPGDGSLALDDEPLEIKSAKPLPSSD